MNKIAVTFSIILNIISLQSHSQMPYLPFFFDFSEIKNTVDSLHKNHAREILVLQSQSLKICEIDNDTLINLILWIDNNNSCYVKIITYNAVYYPIKIKLDSEFFKIDKLSKLFISKDEKILMFTPPLTNENAVFFISDRSSGYFEQPDNNNSTPSTYVPNNARKEQLRKDYYTLLKNELSKLDCNSIGYKPYDREKDFEEVKY
jgi:hypothetical protein